MIHTGDCVEVMAAMDPDSIDAIVTDPPYGLEFMGKEWDRLGNKRDGMTDDVRQRQRESGEWWAKNYGAYLSGVEVKNSPAKAMQSQQWHQRWATEALRVAKPGAYLLAFGGTRTVHRLTVALEDAGWIIRDIVCWVYASGFPKSKASLKPAWEPIVLARKPGPLAPLAIDGCRIGTEVETWPVSRAYSRHDTASPSKGTEPTGDAPAGRWPANVVLTDPIFDGDTEGVVGGGERDRTGAKPPQRPDGFVRFDGTDYNGGREYVTGAYESPEYGDSGTYSRFFLIPKASRSDREPLVPGDLEERAFGQSAGAQAAIARGEESYEPGDRNGLNRIKQRRNTHPTVKPTDLMRHLVRLVTPQGGTVLDPFLGSGTTALAATLEGFEWVGIEREPEYAEIAEQRLVHAQRGLGL